MAKKTCDEILQQVKKILGDNAECDEAITLYEDITDSYKPDGEDWEKKFKENDDMWRKKYTERFFKSDNDPNQQDEEQEEQEQKPLSLDDILIVESEE